MITKEQLQENAERINFLVDRAKLMGDGAPCLGTIVWLCLTDDQYKKVKNEEVSILTYMEGVEAMLVEAGIRT
jgi:hypothetical protein